MLLTANWGCLERQCQMEKYPQTVAWEVHVGEQETITYHAGGAALGQDTRGQDTTSTANLILQGKINKVKIKAKAKLFGADSRRERKMLLSFFHMRRVTKGDLHAHPSGCCPDLPARSQ